MKKKKLRRCKCNLFKVKLKEEAIRQKKNWVNYNFDGAWEEKKLIIFDREQAMVVIYVFGKGGPIRYVFA